MSNVFSRFRDFVFHNSYVRELEAQNKLMAYEDTSDSTEVILDELYPANRTNPPKTGTNSVLLSYEDVPRLRAVVERIADTTAERAWEAWYISRSPTDIAARAIPKHQLVSKDALNSLRTKAETNQNLVQLDEHPLLDLLSVGNPVLDGYQVEKLATLYYLLVGEWFELIEFDESGPPKYLWPIPPHWVNDTPKDDYPFFRVNFYSKYVEIPAHMMVWCKNVKPYNPYRRGTGMGMTLGDEIDTDEYAARVMKAAFLNNNLPHSIVVFPGLRDEQYKTQEKRWKHQYGSPEKAGRVRFMNAADVKQIKLTPTFKDSQMNETRVTQRDIINQSLGIPPEIMGILESSNRATIDAADYIMQHYRVNPLKDSRRRCYQRQLVVFYDERLVLDFCEGAGQDKDRQIETMKSAPYHYTRNQWNTVAGFDDLGDDGELYVMQAGQLVVPADGEIPIPTEEPETPDEEDEIIIDQEVDEKKKR